MYKIIITLKTTIAMTDRERDQLIEYLEDCGYEIAGIVQDKES